MADTNILPMRPARKARPASRPKALPTPRPVMTLQRWIAVGCAVVVAVLLALSLTHLAAGIQTITHCATWEGIALAIGIDAGLVCAEAAQLAARGAAARAIQRWAAGYIAGTVAASAALNALAFAQSVTGPMVYAAVAAGVVVPIAVYALSRISVGLVSR